MQKFQDFLDLADIAKPSDELLNTCAHCDLCLEVCPTYVELGAEISSPRGRIALLRAVADGQVSVTSPVFLRQMDECLGCLACQTACPVGLDYGHLLEAGQAQARSLRRPAWWVRLIELTAYRVLFMKVFMLRLYGRSLWLYQRSGVQEIVRWLGILKLLGLEEVEQLLPRINDHFTVAKGQRYLPPAATQVVSAPDAPPFRRVALLVGCVQGIFFSHVHAATIRVLQANGCEVVLPKGQECCCGLHTTRASDFDRARQLARQNIDSLEAVGPTYIVSNAAGCSFQLKEYLHFLRDDPVYAEKARQFVAKTRDVTELLAELGPRPPRRPLPWKVTYQEPCHLAHAQQVSREPRRVLAAIPGLELIEMAASNHCCGSAGTYNITERELSQRILDRKMENVLATGAEVIASANTGCMVQLQAGLRQQRAPIRLMHIVEILDAAYRNEGV
jgi:glycolate oxidase iron-sulfur subunit